MWGLGRQVENDDRPQVSFEGGSDPRHPRIPALPHNVWTTLLPGLIILD